MKIKPGVRVLGVRPEIVMGLLVMQGVYARLGALESFVVTSIIEGEHSSGSLHYMGCGADLRRPPSDPLAKQIVAEAKAALGDDFDIVLESDHIHMEFQPKKPY